MRSVRGRQVGLIRHLPGALTGHSTWNGPGLAFSQARTLTRAASKRRAKFSLRTLADASGVSAFQSGSYW